VIANVIEKKGLATYDKPGKDGIYDGGVTKYGIYPLYDHTIKIVVFGMQDRGHRMEEERKF
jgi:hypothetical protein